MHDSQAEKEKADLISRMFALLTAKLEDGATIAAECQGKHPREQLRKGAGDLTELLAEATTITAAAYSLLEASSTVTAYDE